MLAEAIVFEKPFDMRNYSREQILERYSPMSPLKSTSWERAIIERVLIPQGGGSSPFKLVIEKMTAEDMVLLRVRPRGISDMASLYVTSGIYDVICPKLLRLDLLEEEGGFLLSYPRFKDDYEYSLKISNAVSEIFRVSVFLLGIISDPGTPKGLSTWKLELANYIDTYYLFPEEKLEMPFSNFREGAKVYKKLFD